MSEWLTTGEMIDRLKVGEVAESKDIRYKVKFISALGIVYVDDDGNVIKGYGSDGKFYIASSYLRDLEWRILPKYVTFEEAMKALKNDKEVWFHRENGKPFIFKANDYFTFRIENLPFSFFTMHELFEGKWQIIE